MYTKTKELCQKFDINLDEFKVINKRWHTLHRRCNHAPAYKDVEVDMTKEQFFEWCMENDFLANPQQHVSRLGDTGPYRPDNMQLLPAIKNLKAIRSKTYKMYMATVDLNKCCKVMDFDYKSTVDSLPDFYENFKALGLIDVSLTQIYRRIKRGLPVVDTRLVTIKLVPCK